MDKFSHMFLVLFYILSSLIILAHFLIRWAIAHRMNTVRSKIKKTTKTAKALRSFHKSILSLSNMLNGKEKEDVTEIVEISRDEIVEFHEEVQKGISEIRHAISALYYKQRNEHRILWPKWAQRKLLRLYEELEVLEHIVKEIPQY